MKKLSIKEKAKAYDEAIKKAESLYKAAEPMSGCNVIIETLFPELKESEDERIRKEIITYLSNDLNNVKQMTPRTNQFEGWIAWLEKQGEQSIQNVPTREIILAIWDLGNEWKELTHGSISTEYGTQLDYIQKHWHESEYYLREKQGKQKPIWSEEDDIEYTSTDAFIEKVEDYLNSQLYDWVNITNPDQRSCANIMPKKDFIEDFVNYMKGE